MSVLKKLFGLGGNKFATLAPEDRPSPETPARSKGKRRNPAGADTVSLNPAAPAIVKEHRTEAEAAAEVEAWKASGFSASMEGPITLNRKTVYKSVARVGGD